MTRTISLSVALDFTRSMLRVLRAGFPVGIGLDLVAQTEIHRREQIGPATAIAAAVRYGESLTAAVDAYRPQFPVWYRRAIAVADRAGGLDRALEQLADHIANIKTTRSAVVQRMAYPSTVFIATIALIVTAHLWILPAITPLRLPPSAPTPTMGAARATNHHDQDRLFPPLAPAPTASRVITIGALAVAAVVTAAGFGAKRHRVVGTRRSVVGHRSTWWRWPADVGAIVGSAVGTAIVVGRPRRCPALAPYTLRVVQPAVATIGFLLSQGVGVHEALLVVARTAASKQLRSAADFWADQVSQGRALSAVLDRYDRRIPIDLLNWLRLAEGGGGMADILIAYDQELTTRRRDRVQTLISLTEPAMILLSGSAVFAFVLNTVLPIIAV